MNDDHSPSIHIVRTKAVSQKRRRQKQTTPSQSRQQSRGNSQEVSTDWGAIIVALFVTIGWTLVTFVVAAVIFLIYFSMGINFNEDFLAMFLLQSIGLCFSLIPVVMGAANLIENVSHDKKRHILTFGSLVFLLDFALLFYQFDAESFIVDTFWLMTCFPAIWITYHFHESHRQKR